MSTTEIYDGEENNNKNTDKSTKKSNKKRKSSRQSQGASKHQNSIPELQQLGATNATIPASIIDEEEYGDENHRSRVKGGFNHNNSNGFLKLNEESVMVDLTEASRDVPTTADRQKERRDQMLTLEPK